MRETEVTSFRCGARPVSAPSSGRSRQGCALGGVCYPSGVELGRVCGASLALALVLAGTSSTARAADAKTSSLSWLRMPGADACVATQPLARAVEERLGRSVFVSAAQADLSVEGRIEKRPNKGWRSVITVRDASGATLGTRELERADGSCEAMTEPVALVIAVMIDPDAALRPKPSEPDVSPPAPAPIAEAPPAETQPSAAALPSPAPAIDRPAAPAPPPRAAPWQFEGHVHATVNHGLAPTLAPGAGVDAILYPPKIPIGFRGYTTLFLPTSAEKDGARASFDMLYAGGSLCPTLRGRVNLLGCVGGHLGLLRPRAETSGRGISEDVLLLWTAMAELRVHVPLVAPIGVSAGVGAGLPILRPELAYRRSGGGGTDTLHRPEVYVLTADVGIGFFFP